MAAAWLAGGRGFSAGNVASLSSSAFTISGSNKYLRALAYAGAGTPANVSSVVLDPAGVNEALTQIETAITFATNFRASVWAKVGPSNVTSKVVTVTWASNQDETMVIPDAYTGIDQSTPTRSLPTPAQGLSLNPALNVNSAAQDLIVGTVVSGSGGGNLTTVASATLTIREKVEGADIGGFEQCAQGDMTSSADSATINYALSATGSDPSWVLFAASLIPPGPTIDTQPADATVPVGTLAMFSVSATASAGSLTYQWQRNPDDGISFEDIAGATSDSLSFITTGVRNYHRYRVIVTDDNSSRTSNPATLRVLMNQPQPGPNGRGPWLPPSTQGARTFSQLLDVRGWLPGVPLQIEKWFSDWLEPAGAAPGGVTVNATVGNLVLGGVSAQVISPTTVNAGQGNLVLGGVSARVQLATAIPGTVGNLVLGGVAAQVIQTTVVNASVGNLLLQGITAQVSQPTNLSASVGNLLLGGVQATVTQATTVNASVGNLLLGGVKAGVNITIGARVGNLVLGGVPADVQVIGATYVFATVGDLALGGVAAQVQAATTVRAGVGNLALGAVPAQVQVATAINAGTGDLTLGHVNARVQVATAVNAGVADLRLNGVAATVQVTEPTTINATVGDLSLAGVPAQVTTVAPTPPPPPPAVQPIGGGGGPGFIEIKRRKRVRVAVADAIVEHTVIVARSSAVIVELQGAIADLVTEQVRVLQRAHWRPARAHVAIGDAVEDDCAALAKSDDPQLREMLDFLLLEDA